MARASSTVAASRRSVVKILTVADPPDYDQPWQTLGATQESGSGAVLETADGPRVITNAHVVQDAAFIEVQRAGQARKFVAEVVGISHECDLALLHVDDAAFFADEAPLEIGPLPALEERVTVLGFPIGGERLSITEGVVSRVEMSAYTQSDRNLLSVQIDAAINAGNSGGPVLREGRLAGIAFQALEDAEGIGYVIPSPVVRHFLQDAADGRVDGFPALGLDIQTLESTSHRKWLGLPRSRRGVLAARIHYGGSCWGQVKEGDVLLSVDGHPVAADGTVPFGPDSWIEYTYVATCHHVGDEVALRLFRNGERRTVRVTLKPHRLLVPRHVAADRPAYYVTAGLLLVPLTRGYLETWGEGWRAEAPAPFVALYDDGARTPGMREVVVLQKVLADAVNRGYHDLESVQITHVGGKRIRSLAHLVRRVERATEPYLHLETACRQHIVIDRAIAAQRHDTVLRRYGVPSDRSAGLPGRTKPRGERP